MKAPVRPSGFICKDASHMCQCPGLWAHRVVKCTADACHNLQHHEAGLHLHAG